MIFIFFSDCAELFVFLLFVSNLFCTCRSIPASGGGTGKCIGLPGSSLLDLSKSSICSDVYSISEVFDCSLISLILS